MKSVFVLILLSLLTTKCFADTFYAVGTGNWNDMNTWASTSGGTPGSGPGDKYPQYSNDVAVFDANSGSITVTINGSYQFSEIYCDGFTGTVTNSGSAYDIVICGTITLCSGMTWSISNVNIKFNAINYENYTDVLITTSGKTLLTSSSMANYGVIFEGTGGNTYKLADDLTVSQAYISVTPTPLFGYGGLDLNTHNINAGVFRLYSGTANLSSGTLSVVGGSAQYSIYKNGGTFNAGTSTVKLTGTTTQYLYHNTSVTYYNFWVANGSSNATVSFEYDDAGSITFNEFKCPSTETGAATIRFKQGITYTFTTFNVSGASSTAKKILESGSPGTAYTFTKTSGTVDAYYLSIKDSNAGGGATWTAWNSTNVSGNSGWIFKTLVNSGFFF